MAEFKLGRLRFVWQGAWVTAHTYVKDDIVRYGSHTYVCLVGGTSSADFYTDLNASTPVWSLMSSGIAWRGNWAISTLYKIGDVIKYGSNTYVCYTGHTSSAVVDSGFYTDLTAHWQIFTTGQSWLGNWSISTYYKIGDIIKYGANTYTCYTGHTSSATVNGGFYTDMAAHWQLFVTGQVWLGNWTTSTYYKISDIIKYGAKDYICVIGHTSSGTIAGGFYSDLALSNWTLMVDGVAWNGTWANSNYYKVGDIVNYGGITYICVTGHSSQSTLELDQGNWSVFVRGIDYTGIWSSANVIYKINDLVHYGANIWICVDAHTSTVVFETNKFSIFVQGLEYVNTWDSSSSYIIGDIATFGGYTYTSLTTGNVANTPATSPASWAPFTTGFTMGGSWNDVTAYLVGTVVNYGGYTYVAMLDSVAVRPPSSPTAWGLLNTGLYNRGNWTSGDVYHLGDIVSFMSSSYTCVAEHTASTPVDPVNDTLGVYWHILAQGSANSFNTTTGDITYRAASGSDARLPLGTDGQVLRVTAGLPTWEYYGVITNVHYVSITGTDAVDYGHTLDKPWRTIQYSCQQISNGTHNQSAAYLLKANRSWAVAEMYYWMLDQMANNIPPFNASSVWSATQAQLDASYIVDAIVFDMTRGGNSQTVETALAYFNPTDPTQYYNAATASAIAYFNPAINKLLTLLTNAMSNSAPVTSYQSLYLPMTPVSITGIVGNGAVVTVSFATEPNVLFDIGGHITIAGVAAYNGTYTVIAATTTGVSFNSSVTTAWVSGGTVVGVPFTQTINLSYTTESGSVALATSLVGIITSAITAGNTSAIPLPNQGETVTLFVKNGTYAEILPISVPNNVSLVGDELRGVIVEPMSGYSGSNMFYVRNGSIIRNMTLTGLHGVLSAPNAYGTKRPTGGSFISLDPGTGPTDTTVWIKNRSPYIQNVTSTNSSGTVGMKIDGKLHNGGNKCILANDFTQILNDGIGVWCTGTSARAECVSVFTYYNYIGYLSEAGGNIRAANSNHTYGTYGGVSEGYDVTETPATGVVTNQASQAIVTNVLTNGNNILWLEYSNAGQLYTAATYSISSSNGFGAFVSSINTYSNAVCEVRITSGGSGYISTINSAQTGTGTSIILSAADTSTTGQYIGMRIIITAGTGAGQYGYIQAYNAGTKEAIIYSNGILGWNIAVAGTLVVPVLDQTTTYSIEPRVTFTGVGTGALARASVVSGVITAIRIINPGSGYTNVPTIGIIDPNATTVGTYTPRIQNGVLGQPTWSSRGTNYNTAVVTVAGDGYAEFLQIGFYLNIRSLTAIPTAGASITIAGNANHYAVVAVSNQTGSAGNYTATLQINPMIGSALAPVHGASVTMRSRYSQMRLTGHDFAYVGTGNLVSTNYPGIPLIPGSASAQVRENNGGRVFYSATDQDGNFNVGNLFTIQQATGVASLNVSNFNLSGLYSLQLGGSGATVTQFSTDGTFTANSDGLLPTQKAIKTYIASQLGAGGANLAVTSLGAGNVVINGNTIVSINGVDLTIQASAGRSVQFPTMVTHGIGSLTTYTTDSSIVHDSGSTDTYSTGSSLVLNGTTVLPVLPVNPTDLTNKKYVDRVLSLNNLWTSAW